MASPLLSFNKDVFVKSLEGMQTFKDLHTGFNCDKEGVLYFRGAESDYTVRDFNTDDYKVEELKDSVRAEYHLAFDNFRADITNGDLPDEAKTERIEAFNAFESLLDAETEIPTLRLSVLVSHIRNNEQDDNCRLDILVGWFSTVEQFFPVDISKDVVWGGSPTSFVANGLTYAEAILATLSTTATAVTHLNSIFSGPLGKGFSRVKLGLLGVNLCLKVALKINEMLQLAASDGGRAYFASVCAQVGLRLMAAMEGPAFANEVVLDTLCSINSNIALWETSYSRSSYQHRWWMAYCSTKFREDTLGTYDVSLPCLGFTGNGRFFMLSFKISVAGEKGHIACNMIFSNDGSLLAINSYLEADGDQLVMETTWKGEDEDTDKFIFKAVGQYYQIQKLSQLTSSSKQQYLPSMGVTYMQIFAASFLNVPGRDRSIINVPCFPSMATFARVSSFHSSVSNSSVVATKSDGNGLLVFSSTSNHLHASHFRLKCEPRYLSHGSDEKYDSGDSPSIATMVDDRHFLEVHRGHSNNKLYYSILSLDSSNKPLFDNIGHHFTHKPSGSHPSVAIGKNLDGTNRIWMVNELYSGSYHMYYRNGTYNPSDKTVTWTSGIKFGGDASNSHPSITIPPTGNSNMVLVVYDRGENIFLQKATVSSKTLSWIDKASVPAFPGQKASICSFNQGSHILVAAAYQDPGASFVCVAVGILNGSTLKWSVAGQVIGNGSFPCITPTVGGCIVSYQDSDHSGEVRVTGYKIDFPDEYFAPA